MPIINMVYKKKKWWKPWANTIAYFPFENDTADHSGNGVTLTTTSTPIQQSIGYKFTWQTSISSNQVKTVSVWIKMITWGDTTWIATQDCHYICYYYTHDSGLWQNFVILNQHITANATTNANTWYNIITVVDTANNKTYGYINGVKYMDYSGVWNNLGSWIWLMGSANNNGEWILSDCIIESVARTDQEVLDYYNNTKWTYGL